MSKAKENGAARTRLYDTPVLNELLADLGPEERVAALGEMGRALKDGPLSPEVAAAIVAGARQQPAEQPAPAPRTSPSETAPDGGRDRKGRFVSGNQFSRGNPFTSRQLKLRRALGETVLEDDVRKVAYKLIRMAAGGSIDAARLLFEYVFGKPALALSVERLDREHQRQERSKRASKR
jgi:hypothetical protein